MQSVIIASSILLFLSVTEAADWRFFSKYKDIYYYDGESLVYPVKNLARVSSKIVYDLDTVFKVSEEMGDKYSDLKEAIYQIEIDCLNKRMQTKSITYCDSKGNAIESKDKGLAGWKSISSESPYADLYREVCRKKKKE